MPLRRCLRLVAVLGVVGCTRQQPNEVAPPPTLGNGAAAEPAHAAEPARATAGEDDAESAPPTSAADEATLQTPAFLNEPPEWIALVRMGRYADAQQRLEALPEMIKSLPAIRMVRARVAIELGNHAAAVALLAGLEEKLPPLADDIQRLRAESSFAAGPYEEAARYFAKQSGIKSLIRAAIAFDKAGLPSEARSAADRIIATAKGEKDGLVARVIRARLAEAAGESAVALDDARWIVVHAPESEQAPELESKLLQQSPDHPLTGRERMLRAERLADAGRLDDALAELDRAAKGSLPPEGGELDLTRARLLYRARGHYAEAASLFQRAAGRAGPRQAEALFYAARARSRADHDDEAAAAYRALAKRFPTSSWGDEASYLAARLSFLHARWIDAASAYRRYLRAYPRGKWRASASYERAVALLAGGQYKSAGTELHELALAASGQEGARLRELEGVAALKSGDRAGAIERWVDAMQSAPLSFAALAARARLQGIAAKLPPLIEPSDDKPAEPLAVKLPAGAEFYHRLGLDGDAEAYLRARESEITAQAPGREKEALCAAYAALGRAGRAYRVAMEAVRGATLLRAPSPFTRWGWDCLYPRPYAAIIPELESRESLPSGLVHAVMRQESAFDPEAVSGASAVGLLQLMPATAAHIAREASLPLDEKQLKSPSVNLDLGVRYLGRLLHMFGGSVALAAAAYNAGPHAVERWLARGHNLDLDLWTALIPYEETRGYVPRVVSNLAHYAFMQGGEGAVPPLSLKLPGKVALGPADY